MKVSVLQSLSAGATLTLKPARAAAYSMPDSIVVFSHLQPRAGYSMPWVIDINGNSYKPSDFTSKANDMKTDSITSPAAAEKAAADAMPVVVFREGP